MQTTHTPGPWAFRPESRNIVSTPENDGHYVTIGGLSESLFITAREHAANARLLAAAPELLAALVALVEEADLGEVDLDDDDRAKLDDARAAIAKATGAA